jgi:radical SAM protein with 4Fe4S-binding SPASM domain
MFEPIRVAFADGGLRFPSSLALALTDDCNLTCGHCWVEARPRHRPRHVPAGAARRLVEEFAALGGAALCLTGGEPLLCPDWLEVIQSATRAGIQRVTLQTNALLLGDRQLAALLQAAPSELGLQISLDGAVAATHDRVRGKGTFAATLAVLRRLRAAGLAGMVTLCFTEMAHNLTEFPALLGLASELGVAGVRSGGMISGGRGAAGTGLRPAAPGQYLELVKHFDADPDFRRRYAELGMLAALEWWLAKPSSRPCSGLAGSPYVDPGGRLFPCTLCHCEAFSLAGIYEHGLRASLEKVLPLWIEMKRLARQRFVDLSTCRECPERSVCAAGCIGRAWASCGDLLAADDRCATRRLLGRARREKQT